MTTTPPKAIATVVLACFTTAQLGAAPLSDWRPSPALLASLATQAPAAQASPTACADSRAQGRKDASANHGSMGWLVGGLAAGVGGGLIGMGVITPVAAFSNPQPEDVPATADQSCYRLGYKDQAKGKNWKSALIGSALGTAAWFAWYMAATAE